MTDDELSLLVQDMQSVTQLARLNHAEASAVVRKLEELGFVLADTSGIKARAAAIAAARLRKTNA